MEKYQKFSVEDFVLDDSFRLWVINPNLLSEKKWSSFLKEYPERKEDILQAKLIVQKIESIENGEVLDESIQKLWLRINKKQKPYSIRKLSIAYKYAAIILLAFFVGGYSYKVYTSSSLYNANLYNEITVPYGERSKIVLYDGSQVWLNSGTTLKFPVIFNNGQRKVEMEGEAYFEVSSDNSKPFVVQTKMLNIEVHGTKFNVCAYPDEPEVKATLDEGKIKTINRFNGRELDLIPGEQVILHSRQQELKIKKVDTDLYTSWKENVLRFQDEEFRGVITKMERWYDVDIEVDRHINMDKLYTMTIKTESLREMLNLLSYTMPMEYHINEDKVYINKP